MQTIFVEHCLCCNQPITITYKGEEFSGAKCGCPIRIMIRQSEHEYFVAKIREAAEAAPYVLNGTIAEQRVANHRIVAMLDRATPVGAALVL